MTQRVDGVALGSIAVGSIVLYAGITGKSIPAALQSIIQGKAPSSANAYPIQQITQDGSQSVQSSSSGGSGSPAIGGTSAGGSAAQYQAYAFMLFPQYGWGADQRQPLISLWNQESGWRVDATNPSSGAYGIPQSLPASKMATAGSDWKTNAATQIKWGLGYISGRYGNPAGAWAHEQSNNWY